MTVVAASAPIAFLGLGRLGGPMAKRLVRAGRRVRGVDPSELAQAAATDGGVEVVADPAEAATGADLVIVMVRDDDQARDVLCGERGALPTLPRGAAVVIHSTVGPGTVADLASACAGAGIRCIDAGVSGGPDRAANGSLVAVCGGTSNDIERVRDTLSAYASDIIHCGPVGAGMAAKLARNLSQYGVWAALFEGMAVAESAGVDLATYARYVRLSGLDANNDVVLGRTSLGPEDTADDPDRARHLRWAVHLGHKDLDDVFELARQLGVEVPIGEYARNRYADILGWNGASPQP